MSNLPLKHRAAPGEQDEQGSGELTDGRVSRDKDASKYRPGRFASKVATPSSVRSTDLGVVFGVLGSSLTLESGVGQIPG